MSSAAEIVMWRKKQQREREEWVVLCLQESRLVWVSAGGSDPTRPGLEREMKMGKVKEKGGWCWLVALLRGLQKRAESCAERQGHVDL